MGALLKLLYRGPLSSCNYRCDYCPFAKRRETPAELRYDQQCLERFTQWVGTQTQRQISILFTPWGEALTRRWYRDAMLTLEGFPNVDRVAIQTNLSCRLDWLSKSERSKIAFWATYHPQEVALERFLKQCQQLDELEIRYSVGIVGLRENLELAQELRASLNEGVYLWVNAYKREDGYYDPILFEKYRQIDPLFPVNSVRHPSFNQHCLTGESVLSIDGQGNIQRCHFVKQNLGNIYQDELDRILKPRRCPNATCGCHIGYVHMPALNLYPLFGSGVLERIPLELPFVDSSPCETATVDS